MKQLITFLAIVGTTMLWAQTPEQMSYQAVIRNSANELVANTQVGMQLSLLQGTPTGTAVYTETQTPTSNANGLVSLQVGTGTTSDDFSSIDWANGPYFIKTETDPTGGTNYTITGTSQLMSVPYALYAKTADGVLNDQVDDADADPANELTTSVALNGTNLETTDAGGTIVTDLSSLQDGVTDADADPENELITSVALNGSNLETTDAGGTIVTDLSSLQGIEDDDWTITGNDIYSAVAGNVGVGTTSPSTKFEVVGKISLSESLGDEMVISNSDTWLHGQGNLDFGDGGDHFMIASKEGSFESAGIYGDGDHVTIWSPGDAAPGQPSAYIYVNDDDGYDSDNDPFNNNALKAYLNTAGNWVAASDRNRKENIQELDGVLQKLMLINGYSYNFKLLPVEVKKGDQKVTTYGVIAQEVVQAFPEIVDISEDGSHYVSYTELIPILIEGIQEQQRQIQELREKNDVLHARIKNLNICY